MYRLNLMLPQPTAVELISGPVVVLGSVIPAKERLPHSENKG